MKLAVDLQACLTDSRERGIGRYALGLVTALHALRSPAFELSVLLDSARPDRLGELRRRLRGAGVDAPSHCYSYPTFEGFTEAFAPLADCGALLKARFAEASGADVLLVGSCFEVGDRFATGYALAALPDLPKAVIAYDLIPLLFPERYLPPGQFISEWYRRRLEAFRGFDLYLAISQSTRDDLIALLGIAPERIEVIDAGIDTQFFAAAGRGLAAAELAALGIQRPFVLTVGNADWRKNCLGALEAFARLPAAVRGQHQLVFTRVGADVQEALDGSLKHLRESVLILGSVDEKTLVDLYASCRVFFFPSLYEGFGLPVLEAMAAGAPVLCASRGALPEVVHRPECLFDPDDLAGAAARLQKALMDEPFRALLLAGAREHAAAYGWERSARRALSALQRLQPGPARAERVLHGRRPMPRWRCSPTPSKPRIRRSSTRCGRACERSRCAAGGGCCWTSPRWCARTPAAASSGWFATTAPASPSSRARSPGSSSCPSSGRPTRSSPPTATSGPDWGWISRASTVSSKRSVVISP